MKINLNEYPFELDLKLVRGDTRKLRFEIVDEAELPVDVSFWSDIYLTANKSRTPVDDRDQVFQLIGEVDEETGTNVLLFTPDKEAEAAKGYFDIQVTNADEEIVTIAKGRVVILQDITKE